MKSKSSIKFFPSLTFIVNFSSKILDTRFIIMIAKSSFLRFWSTFHCLNRPKTPFQTIWKWIEATPTRDLNSLYTLELKTETIRCISTHFIIDFRQMDLFLYLTFHYIDFIDFSAVLGFHFISPWNILSNAC